MKHPDKDPSPNSNPEVSDLAPRSGTKPTESLVMKLRSKRTMLSAIILIIAIVSAFCFMYQKGMIGSYKQTSKNQTTQKDPVITEPGFYIRYTSHDSQTKQLQVNPLFINAKTNKAIELPGYESTADSSIFSNQLPITTINGKPRKFYLTKPTGIAFQDGSKPAKTIYSAAAKTGETVTIDLGSVAQDGSSVDFYEYRTQLEPNQDQYREVSSSASLKRVDVRGRVTQLASHEDIKKLEASSELVPLLPKGRSKDGKTVYVALHPSAYPQDAADLIALDTTTHSFTKLFADPYQEFSTGSWQQVTDSLFWIETFNGPSHGRRIYDEAIKEKTRAYLYDASTKTYKKIFESSATESRVQVLGVSQERDKVYVAITKPVKGETVISDLSGHSGPEALSELSDVRAYTPDGSKYTSLKLPLDYSKTEIRWINSVGGTLLICPYPDYREASPATKLYLGHSDDLSKAIEVGTYRGSVDFLGFGVEE